MKRGKDMKNKNILFIFTFIICISILSPTSAKTNLYNLIRGDKYFKTKCINVMENKKSEADISKKNVIYVSSKNGDDNNKGTKSLPYKTIKKGLSKTKAGYTLVLRSGNYKEKIDIKKKGNKNKYITVRNHNKEKVVIDGSNIKKHSSIIDLNNSSYIKIMGLTVKNAKGNDIAGINLSSGANHIILTNNRITNIRVKNPKKEEYTNGILLLGENGKHKINNVLINNNKLYDMDTGWGECISVSANNENINIIKNNLNKTGNIGIDLTGNYGYCKTKKADFPRKCFVYKNIIKNEKSKYATSYGLYVDGGQDIRLQSNKITNSGGGIEIGSERKPIKKYSTKNIKVYNNKVYDCSENGITVGGYKKSLGTVYNVTLYKNKCINSGKKEAILTISKAKDINVKNNIFSNKYSNSPIVYIPFNKKYSDNLKFNKNIYYSKGKASKSKYYYKGKYIKSFKKWTKVSKDKEGKFKKVNY